MSEQGRDQGVAGGDVTADPGTADAGRGDAPVTFDDGGRVNCTVLCVACGHNLRGLLPTGVCTECGHPVITALRSPLGRARATRLRRATSLLTGTIPWLWLPLSWPLAYFACWRLTSRDPVAQSGDMLITLARYGLFGGTLLAWAWLLTAGSRAIALIIPVTILLLMLFSFVVALRLNARYGSSRMRGLGRFLFALFTIAPLLAVVLSVTAGRGADPLVQVIVGLLALIAVLAMPGAWLAALIGLWRTLEVYEIQAESGGRLHLLRAQEWQRPTAASA